MKNENSTEQCCSLPGYEYVDRKIAEALTYDQSTNFGHNHKLVDDSTLCIDWINLDLLLSSPVTKKSKGGTPLPLQMEMLITLASQSEIVIFNIGRKAERLPRFILPLFNYIDNSLAEEMTQAHTVIGTQFVIAMLESEIRHIFEKRDGHAPILKDMIENLGGSAHEEYNSIAQVLKTLLLPTGINLRNLLWHGYLSSLPRRWFALCAVLIVSIRDIRIKAGFNVPQDSNTGHTVENNEVIEELRKHQATKLLISHGQFLHSASGNIFKLEDYAKSFIPTSHHCILHVALNHYIKYDACFIAILAPLLEHSLRLLWCDCNNRLHDRVAHPGAYYVTLDGHGQRNKHDLILNPFVSSADSSSLLKNNIIQKLGAGVTSLLMDLFISPSGPNIRAAVAHGLWDKNIISELKDENYNIVNSSPPPLIDITYLLLSILHILSENFHPETSSFSVPQELVASYQPLFSYTASTLRDVELLLKELDYLSNFISSTEIINTASQDLSSRHPSIHKLYAVISLIPVLKQRIFSDMYINGTWTIESLYNEYDMSVKLSNCGAARALINDITCGLSSYASLIMEYHKQYLTGDFNSRQKKRFLNVASISLVALDLYTFTLYVAFCSIIQEMGIEEAEIRTNDTSSIIFHPASLIKAVERSRMVVSTFSTFSAVNIHRAIKAVDVFVVSKHAKMILSFMHKNDIESDTNNINP